jgi:uncharacterized protein (TIGR03437 family)
MRNFLCSAGMFGLFLASFPQGVAAQYLTVLTNPNSPSAQLSVYTAQLDLIGTVAVAQGARQVLISENAAKLFVVSENEGAPLTAVGITSSGLSSPRIVTGTAGIPSKAIVSGNGELIYLLTKSPAKVYAIRIAEETQAATAIDLPADPLEASLTPDGRYLVVLCGGNQLVGIDTQNWQAAAPVAISGTFTGPGPSLSVAPSGSIYISGSNVLIEHRGEPPFEEMSRSTLTGGPLQHPGPLSFVPSGRRAFVVNRSLFGASLGVIDLSLRGETTGAGLITATASLGVPSGSNPGSTGARVASVVAISEDLAIAYTQETEELLVIQDTGASTLNVANLRIGQDPVAGVKAYTVSNEFPNKLRLFFTKGDGSLWSFPLTGIGGVLSKGSVTGDLSWVSTGTEANVGSLYGYGAGKLDVRPSATVRYFVRAIGTDGRPAKGKTLQFRALTEGARVVPETGVTNREGYVSVEVQAPAAPGPFSISVTHSNLPALTLTSTVVTSEPGGGGTGPGTPPPSVPRLIKFSGDGQLLPIGASLNPLAVKAIDADGKPIANKRVVWQSPNSSVVIVSQTDTFTDEEGVAKANFFITGLFGALEPIISVSIEAISDIGSVTFNATAYPNDQFGMPTIQLVSPDPSNKVIRAKLGTPLPKAVSIRIFTNLAPGRPFSLPVPKVGLEVVSENTDPAEGPVAACQEGTALSNDQGIAECTLITKGKTGRTVLKAVVGGGLLEFGGIELIVDPGDPVAPVIVSGNNQTGRTGSVLASPLVARIVDAGGQPLAGQAVVWSVSNSNALTLTDTISVSNNNGEVSTRVKLGNVAGTFQVIVKANNLQSAFTVVVQPSATRLVKVQGDGQPVVPINTQFPDPLIVRVLDAQDSPLSGVPVVWSISGPGTLSATSTTTGPDGRTQVTVTAGTTAGSIVVTASVSGLSPVTFSLQSRLPGPAVTAESFRNYATGQAGLAPGNLVLLTGAGIAKNVTDLAVANIFFGRLPQDFRGLVVEFRSQGNSYYAPIYWIAREGQTETALIQVPYEISGPTVDVIVRVDGVSTTVNSVPVSPVSPGIIEDVIDGRRAAIVVRSDGLVATKAVPARRGETVRLYAIGLGQTQPKAETNRLGQADQLVVGRVAVGIDNAGVEVIRAKMAENLIGIYEVIFKIPEDAQLGDRPLGLIVAAPDGTPFYAQGSIIPVGPAQ